MLTEVGFAYAHRIDPFDGGPHFHAKTDDISLVRATRIGRVAAGPDETVTPAPSVVPIIVARERAEAPHFVAARTIVSEAGLPPAGHAGDIATLALAPEARDALQVAPGDEIAYLRLP
jgi:arginine N-succinyltransferase